MKPLWVWIRSGWAIVIGLVVLGAVANSVVFVHDWHLEADWGLRLTSSTVAFVSPMVAAAAAYETSKRHHPTFAAFADAGTRRVLTHVLPAISVLVTAAVAYLIVWMGVLATTAASGGIGVTDLWVFPETLLPVIAAAFLGCLVGHWIAGMAAPIAAALLVLVAAIAASPWGKGPFEAVTTYGTLTGLERPPAQAAAVVLASIASVAICTVGVAQRVRGVALRWVQAAVAGSLVAVSIVPVAWPWSDQVFRPSTEAIECVGSAPALCGPRSRVPLLAMAQPDFQRAYERLAGTEFTRPTRFTVTRLNAYTRLDGAAPLDFDPGALTDLGYPTFNIVSALLRPHECRGLFDAQASVPILEAQAHVDPWLTGVVEGRRSPTPVPEDIEKAFTVITDCEVFTGEWK